MSIRNIRKIKYSTKMEAHCTECDWSESVSGGSSEEKRKLRCNAETHVAYSGHTSVMVNISTDTEYMRDEGRAPEPPHTKDDWA